MVLPHELIYGSIVLGLVAAGRGPSRRTEDSREGQGQGHAHAPPFPPFSKRVELGSDAANAVCANRDALGRWMTILAQLVA